VTFDGAVLGQPKGIPRDTERGSYACAGKDAAGYNRTAQANDIKAMVNTS